MGALKQRQMFPREMHRAEHPIRKLGVEVLRLGWGMGAGGWALKTFLSLKASCCSLLLTKSKSRSQKQQSSRMVATDSNFNEQPPFLHLATSSKKKGLFLEFLRGFSPWTQFPRELSPLGWKGLWTEGLGTTAALFGVKRPGESTALPCWCSVSGPAHPMDVHAFGAKHVLQKGKINSISFRFAHF